VPLLKSIVLSFALSLRADPFFPCPPPLWALFDSFFLGYLEVPDYRSEFHGIAAA